ALALLVSGLDVLVVDGRPVSVKPFDQQSTFEPLVSALSAASQRIIDRLGVWEGIAAPPIRPYAQMQVWDCSGTGQI
ncbi:2-octaprenyl-3-methyl-6-methoxy-1,4-benzoquinol hydroxylase, partial [Pseudomonas syringae pv. tagetis]